MKYCDWVISNICTCGFPIHSCASCGLLLGGGPAEVGRLMPMIVGIKSSWLYDALVVILS